MKLIGKKFIHENVEHVVTWNDDKQLRATPLDDETGLTSISFKYVMQLNATGSDLDKAIITPC